MFENLKDELMFHRIKCLFKIQLENNYWFLGLIALVQVFQSPPNTILNGSRLDKSVLILVNTLHNLQLQPVGYYFGQKLEAHPSEGYWSVVSHLLR